MTEGLFRILYCSRNLILESGSHVDDALEQILRTARSNNTKRGVTGALLFNEGFFAQVLEGPRKQVEHVFERIQRDPRHNDVTVLECSDIGGRDFPEWAMARVEPVSAVQAEGTTAALHHAMGSPGDGGVGVLELLRSLVVQEV